MSTLGAIGSAILGGATAARFYQSKQNANTKKNLIGEAYGLASKQLAYRQQNVREDLGESINAGGLGGGGQATNTLAGQQRTNTETQLGLETKDLDFQRRAELAGVRADYTNEVLGNIAGTASTAANIYSGASQIHGAFGLPANNGGLPSGGFGSVAVPGESNSQYNVVG